MEEKRENGNTVLLTVIGVATLLVALVGATFAYFSATVSNASHESVYVSTKTPTALVYSGGPVTLLNAMPGNSTTHKFTVANSADGVTQTYDLDLVIEALVDGEKGFTVTTPESEESGKADYANADKQLFLDISAVSTGTATSTISYTTDAPTKTVSESDTTKTVVSYNLTDGGAGLTDAQKKFIDNQVIKPGETHEYTVTLDFKNLDIKQDNNQGATLRAHIDISDPRSVAE